MILTPADSFWQVYCGHNKWQDVDPKWTESIHDALGQGLPSIRVSTADDNDKTLWFTVDLSDPMWITCTIDGAPKAKARQLRAVLLKVPLVVTHRHEFGVQPEC